jgi:prepilin-type N-terminal cleavage/methylation domain-containing protein/prepilin-type processing-associated H-X9-DG protein
MRRRGFTLVELLVVIGVIALLAGLLLPAISSVRDKARKAECLSNQRQLALASAAYTNDFDGAFMPCATWDGWPVVYWWGTNEAQVDYSAGYVHAYLEVKPTTEQSVFNCPVQPWGSYTAQGAAQAPTSTYGYNGYYLCPPATPGWAWTIGDRPWQRAADIDEPHRVIVFADALLVWSEDQVTNSTLLDPPCIFSGTGWERNTSPTTCFRHVEQAVAAFADGHAASHGLEGGGYASPAHHVGSIGAQNDPYYVPDWREWGDSGE